MADIGKLWDAIYDFVNGKGSSEAKRLEKLTKEMTQMRVDVGFNESSGSYEEGVTLAQVAAWNEYGTEHSPSRPFMRQTMKDHQDDITKVAAAALRDAAASRGDIQPVLNKIGSYTKSCMQKEIRDGGWVANAPSTIAKKGSSRPLIDTGRMRQSVVYKIEKEVVMNDLQMTNKGDLAILNYDIATTDSIKQAILIKLRWFFSEWIYNTNLGIEWFEKILIKNPNKLLVRRMIEDAVLSVDGVTDVSDTKLTIFNETRKARISFKYKTINGAYDVMETIDFEADEEGLVCYVSGETLFLVRPASMFYVDGGSVVFTSYSGAEVEKETLYIGGN